MRSVFNEKMEGIGSPGPPRIFRKILAETDLSVFANRALAVKQSRENQTTDTLK